jgi:6,7-dimethyl-8-ribityllumazine synthase
VTKVPGSFEIPFAAKHLCCELNVDAVIALGCIIKGETMHDVVLANSVTDALMQLNITQNKPVILGVLTVNNQQQAEERVNGTYGDKGKECAEAALRMCEIARLKKK